MSGLKKSKDVKKHGSVNKTTYSKRVTSIILGVALFDIQMTYVLAFLGMTDTAETLSNALVTEVLGVLITYSVKAYLGKRNEENLKHMKGDEEE